MKIVPIITKEGINFVVRKRNFWGSKVYLHSDGGFHERFELSFSDEEVFKSVGDAVEKIRDLFGSDGVKRIEIWEGR